ncbi:hypothetical protein ACROYT_G041987 [Oculina patagonica]
MEVEDFSFCVHDSGTEYVTFKENPTKTRQGGLNTKHRSVLPKMFATGGQRCPVELLKQYLSRRPQELREKGFFYLAIIENPKTNVWYKKQRLGFNSIDNMMRSVVKNTPIEKSKKRLTNHSARKTVVKKLTAASVERQSIIHVTGQVSEKSLNDYDEGSEKEQQQLANIISMPPQSAASSSFAGVPAMRSFPATTSRGEQVNTSSHAYTVNNFYNCQVTFNVIQGQCTSPKSVNPNAIHRLVLPRRVKTEEPVYRTTNMTRLNVSAKKASLEKIARKNTFHYNSTYWSDQNEYNLRGGETGFDTQETKLPTYWNTSFSKICLGMKIGQQINFIVINKQANSLYSLIADGQYRNTSLGRDTWKSLIGTQASLQRNCDKEGFNAVSSDSQHSKARIGWISNQENDCGTCDSRIGFGTGGYADDNNTCGNEATHSPDNGEKHIKAMGYILVQ